MHQTILVTGASSKVGQPLVKFLAEAGHKVKAATRHPQNITPTPLVEAVTFDYDEPSTFATALANVDSLFIVERPADEQAKATVAPLIDVAKSQSIRKIVMMTAMGVEYDPSTPLHQLELYLMDSGIPYTILRPNWFMQNFSHGFLRDMIRYQGGIFVPDGGMPVSFIDTRDIAKVTMIALTQDGHENQAYTLTGGEAISHEQVAQRIGDATGTPVQYAEINDEQMFAGLKQADYTDSQARLVTDLFIPMQQGLTQTIMPSVKEITGQEAIPFTQFVHDFAEQWQLTEA